MWSSKHPEFQIVGRWVGHSLWNISGVTSRAQASRVTEVSRGGRTYKDKGAYRNSRWPPGWHGRWLRDLWEAFVFDMSQFLMMPRSLDLACFWHDWILTDLPVGGCLSGRLFSPWDFSLNFLFWWCPSLSIRFQQSTSQYCFVLQSLHKVLPSDLQRHVPTGLNDL